MQCLSPISIKDSEANHSSQRVIVPCGKCYSCLSRRRNDWSFRLNQELKASISAYFITLTYDDENVPIAKNGVPTVKKSDVQLFMKRLRKHIEPDKVRYFIVSEYGENTYRPHYHLILFNFPHRLDVRRVIEKTWSLGFVDIGKVTGASIHYVTKYCLAYNDFPEWLEKTWMLCSKRPAIGSNYLTEKSVKWHKSENRSYVLQNGVKLAMPRYYRDKIFTDEEKKIIRRRQLLSLGEMDKEYDNKYSKYDDNAVANCQPSMNFQMKSYYVRKIDTARKLIKNKL